MVDKVILKKQTLNYKQWVFFKPLSILRVGFLRVIQKQWVFFMVGFFYGGVFYDLSTFQLNKRGK